MSDIIIERGALKHAGSIAAEKLRAGTAAIITDDKVDVLHADTLKKSLENAGWLVVKHVFPNGESSKNLKTYVEILSFLADNRLTRTDAIFALGGGVTGDMAGFAAATYLRGIKLVQIPTTLLACVDSSVGGKTAVDLPQGKNLVGAFYQPHVVIIDPDTLSTLPDSVFTDGMAEVVKYAALSDESLFKLFDAPRNNIEKIITRCINMKRAVVEKDEKDTGLRQTLNFGHTFGHAVEKLSGFTVTHGQGVAIGMAIMARACTRRGICPAVDCDKLISILQDLGLPTHTDYSADAIYDAVLSDKKRAGENITLVIMRAFGRCDLFKTDMPTTREFLKSGMQA